MKIYIDMPDEVILTLAQTAEKSGRSIEELIIERCTEPDDLLVELDDAEIEQLLRVWFEFAVKDLKGEEAFTLQQLVQRREGRGEWTGYSVVTRKKMGKRFKALIESDHEFNGYRLTPSGKTITGAALYVVQPVSSR